VISTLRAENQFEPGMFTTLFTNGKTGNELKLFTCLLDQKKKPAAKVVDVDDDNEG
jgi:hypothetical protein